MGLLSSVLGGNKAYKESIKDLQKAKDLEMNYYQEQAYADPLQDSANQAALRQARELLMANNKRTAGSAAVTGATDESVALQKQGANQSLENITATAKKDQAMKNYLDANRSYTEAINNVKQQQAQQESSALGGLLNTGITAAATVFGGPIGGAVASQITKKK
jgi:hypothetical protein